MKRRIVFSIAVAGIAAISSQIVLVRELLIVFCGNELSVAFILASWLIGGAAGSAILGALADKFKTKTEILGACQAALALSLPLAIVAARSVRPILGINPGEIVPLALIACASLAVLLPSCLVFGFMFSVASRAYKADSAAGARAIGEVYVIESLGAMAGGVVTSFVLIKYFSSIQIIAALSLLLAAASFILLRSSIKSVPRRILVASAALIFIANAALWILGGWAAIESCLLKKQWLPEELLASKNSIYGNVTVTRRLGQFSFFDNGLHLYTVPDAQPAEEAVHFALLEHPDPRKVLLIGGAAGGLLEEALKHPVEKIDYIELDPLIIKMAKDYLPQEYSRPLSNPRAFAIFEDARRYIKRTDKKYDVIIIDLGDPYTAQLNRFYTLEFFKEAGGVLADGGVLSFGLSSSDSYIGKELADMLGSIYATLGRVFADVKIIPGQMAYFLASSKIGVLTNDHKVLMARAAERGVELKYVREYYLFWRMSPELTSYTYGVVRARGNIEIHRAFRPSAYYYGLKSWASRFKDSYFKNILNAVTPKNVWSTIWILYAIILASGLYGIGVSVASNRPVILSVFANGFSQMALQVVMLLAFQMIYGYMFYKLGAILTAFMAGASGGGYFGIRACARRDERGTRRLVILLESGLSVYPLLLCLLLSYLAGPVSGIVGWAGSNVIFVLMSAFSGFLGGAIFPAACKLCLSQDSQIGRVAGANYGTDLFGACAGALFTGVFLIPVLGIPQTCLAVTGLNFSILLVFAAREAIR